MPTLTRSASERRQLEELKGQAGTAHKAPEQVEEVLEELTKSQVVSEKLVQPKILLNPEVTEAQEAKITSVPAAQTAVTKVSLAKQTPQEVMTAKILLNPQITEGQEAKVSESSTARSEDEFKEYERTAVKKTTPAKQTPGDSYAIKFSVSGYKDEDIQRLTIATGYLNVLNQELSKINTTLTQDSAAVAGFLRSEEGKSLLTQIETVGNDLAWIEQASINDQVVANNIPEEEKQAGKEVEWLEKNMTHLPRVPENLIPSTEITLFKQLLTNFSAITAPFNPQLALHAFEQRKITSVKGALQFVLEIEKQFQRTPFLTTKELSAFLKPLLAYTSASKLLNKAALTELMLTYERVVLLQIERFLKNETLTSADISTLCQFIQWQPNKGQDNLLVAALKANNHNMVMQIFNVFNRSDDAHSAASIAPLLFAKKTGVFYMMATKIHTAAGSMLFANLMDVVQLLINRGHLDPAKTLEAPYQFLLKEVSRIFNKAKTFGKAEKFATECLVQLAAYFYPLSDNASILAILNGLSIKNKAIRAEVTSYIEELLETADTGNDSASTSTRSSLSLSLEPLIENKASITDSTWQNLKFQLDHLLFDTPAHIAKSKEVILTIFERLQNHYGVINGSRYFEAVTEWKAEFLGKILDSNNDMTNPARTTAILALLEAGMLTMDDCQLIKQAAALLDPKTLGAELRGGWHTKAHRPDVCKQIFTELLTAVHAHSSSEPPVYHHAQPHVAPAESTEKAHDEMQSAENAQPQHRAHLSQ